MAHGPIHLCRGRAGRDASDRPAIGDQSVAQKGGGTWTAAGDFFLDEVVKLSRGTCKIKVHDACVV